MPFAQPTDADQRYYSDIPITFVGSASPSAVIVSAPVGVSVTYSGTGVYTVQLSAAYVAASPPIDAVVFTQLQIAAGNSDNTHQLVLTTAGTTISAGTFQFVYTTYANPGVPAAGFAATTKAHVLIKLKFATPLVAP